MDEQRHLGDAAPTITKDESRIAVMNDEDVGSSGLWITERTETGWIRVDLGLGIRVLECMALKCFCRFTVLETMEMECICVMTSQI